MFTGLVEEKGYIKSLKREGSNLNIEIACKLVLEDIKLGDSISVDGACQTVTKFDSESFWVTAIDETLKLTNFNGFFEPQNEKLCHVNLERCLRPFDRLGGHIVQGHVDGVAKIIEIKDLQGSKEFFVELPEHLSKYVILKGSITVSGISLTVASIEKNIFSVAIIPKTLEVTTLGNLRADDQVNIEVDVLAKYVEKLQQQ